MPIPPNTLRWEALEETYDAPEHPPNSYRGYTYRASVPGGWLVAVWAGDTQLDHAWGGGLTFVPDPQHQWEIAVRKLRSAPIVERPKKP